MPKIIIALDYSSKKEAMDLIYNLNPKKYYLKVGKRMFTLFGKKFIYELQKLHFNIFLDLKFCDTPDTIFSSVQAVADMGVWMLTIHAFGGSKMMKSAKLALKPFNKQAPLLMGVTMLTSFSVNNLQEIGISSSIKKYTLILSNLVNNCNLDGIICPGNLVNYVKKNIVDIKKKFIYAVPGIRIKNDCNHDQIQISTIKSIKNSNVDYIIVGRTVTHAKNPIKILKKNF